VDILLLYSVARNTIIREGSLVHLRPFPSGGRVDIVVGHRGFFLSFSENGQQLK
jgi:hypothetical protein